MYRGFIGRIHGLEEASSRRVYSVRDIVERRLFIGRDNVRITNHPAKRVSAVFNPSVMVRDDRLIIFARILYGYYMYVSSIARLEIDLEELFSNNLFIDKIIDSQIIIYPDNKYDMVGVEDPRLYVIDDYKLITYCGRSTRYYELNIFSALLSLMGKSTGYYGYSGVIQATYPMTTVMIDEAGYRWRKIHVYSFNDDLRGFVKDDRDSFLAKINNTYYLFHRPTMIDEHKYLLISRVTGEIGDLGSSGFRVVGLADPVEVLPPARFEEKIGWAMPPIRLSSNKLLVFMHGVDRELTAYWLFAAELEFGSDGVAISAVTPEYIMGPREFPEIYGERSYTIFPCGLWRLNRDEYVISYGAGDFVVGLGLLRLSDVLNILDRGRIY